ncbi:FAD-dependent monooxygenase [Streptomyces sp. 3N207]|uniref:FAD-dependent monooxygenase n=1 Tax=Streptomyces sp. 3N207 TaxID=3457417 RepID=UPI003FD5FFF7
MTGPFVLRRLDGGNVRVAEQFRDRRVFLVGDSAPVGTTGGSGLSLGLQDAVNLGWNLPPRCAAAPRPACWTAMTRNGAPPPPAWPCTPRRRPHSPPRPPAATSPPCASCSPNYSATAPPFNTSPTSPQAPTSTTKRLRTPRSPSSPQRVSTSTHP